MHRLFPLNFPLKRPATRRKLTVRERSPAEPRHRQVRKSHRSGREAHSARRRRSRRRHGGDAVEKVSGVAGRRGDSAERAERPRRGDAEAGQGGRQSPDVRRFVGEKYANNGLRGARHRELPAGDAVPFRDPSEDARGRTRHAKHAVHSSLAPALAPPVAALPARGSRVGRARGRRGR